jgi:hypothetical protein
MAHMLRMAHKCYELLSLSYLDSQRPSKCSPFFHCPGLPFYKDKTGPNRSYQEQKEDRKIRKMQERSQIFTPPEDAGNKTLFAQQLNGDLSIPPVDEEQIPPRI